MYYTKYKFPKALFLNNGLDKFAYSKQGCAWELCQKGVSHGTNY